MSPTARSARRRLLGLALRYRGHLLLGFLLLAATNGLGLAIPWLIKVAVDSIQGGGSTRTLAGIALGIAGVALAMAAIRTGSRLAILGMSRKAGADLVQDLFEHLQSLPYPYFKRTPAGEVLSRAINDVRLVRLLLGPGVLNACNTAILYAVSLAILLAMNPRLTLVALLPFPFLLVAVIPLTRRIHRHSNRVQEVLAGISTHLQENLNGIVVVKSYVREEAEIRRMRENSARYREENRGLIRARSFLVPIAGGLGSLATLLVLWVGGRDVIAGRFQLGAFIAFTSYLGMLVWPTVALGWILGVLQRGIGAMERIEELFAVSPEEEPGAAGEPPEDLRGEIEFRGFGFAYEDAGDAKTPFRLEGIDLRVPPGTVLGVVGRIGSGKTTLADAIARLVPVPDGTVFVDGTDVNRLSPRGLRRRIGFVPQDAFLFSSTIRENVAYGAGEGGAVEGDEALVESSEIAALARDVDAFPHRYDTPLGERGITLSGGQRQRATLARALQVRPRILILDDALSSVDAATEDVILRGLRRAMRGRTVIVISHRISAVAGADQIVVLEGGRIAERGRHEELVARGGLYARLARAQALESELEEIA